MGSYRIYKNIEGHFKVIEAGGLIELSPLKLTKKQALDELTDKYWEG